jgi:hypothetical protein
VKDSAPIVVGGCYRSGTSLIRRVLNAHPRIYCGPEVKFFRDFRGDYVEDPIRHVRFMETVRSMLPEEDLLEILGQAFVKMHERAARMAGKPRWADKAPENVVFLDEWQRLLGEDWLFVHVVRNPLDTLASIAEAGFPVSIPADLESRVGLYLRYTSAGLDFGDANPDRYVRVVYEQLAREPESTLQTLMEHLGEDLAAEQLTFGDSLHQKGLEDPNVTNTATVHEQSVDRWRTVVPTPDAELIAERTQAVWRRAGGGALLA